MGDAVNLGSRLEGLTRQYNVDIVVSESTASAVPEFSFRELGRVRVKGKLKPVTIYEPIGLATELTPERRGELQRHQRALDLLHSQQWDAAEQAFRKLAADFPQTPLYGLYLERIEYYKSHPPGEGWDGVFDFKSK
jgi:adenylate cyclase